MEEYRRTTESSKPPTSNLALHSNAVASNGWVMCPCTGRCGDYETSSIQAALRRATKSASRATFTSPILYAPRRRSGSIYGPWEREAGGLLGENIGGA